MSTVTPPAPVDLGPSVPPKLRTAVYYAGLIIGGLTILVTGTVAAVAPEAVGTVLAVSGAITGASTFVLGGLAAAFRPTAGLSSTPGPVLIDGDTWGDGTSVDGPVIGG